MHFPFITYGMVLYINDSIPTNTNIEQMHVYARRASLENVGILHS